MIYTRLEYFYNCIILYSFRSREVIICIGLLFSHEKSKDVLNVFPMYTDLMKSIKNIFYSGLFINANILLYVLVFRDLIFPIFFTL